MNQMIMMYSKQAHIRILWIFLFLVLFSNQTQSAPVKKEKIGAEFWGSYQLKYPLFESLDIRLAQDLRFQDNLSKTGQVVSDLGLKYKISSYFGIAAYYRSRYITKTDFGQNEVYFNFYSTVPISRLKLTHRIRFHRKFQQMTGSSDILRNKFTLKYSLTKKIKPFVAVDLFFPLNENIERKLRKMRYFAGSEIKMSRQSKVEFWYMYEKELNTEKPNFYHIFGLTYSYSI